MLNVVKKLFILLTGILLQLSSQGEDIKFTLVLSSQRISLQDYLQVQFTIENGKKVSQFVPPSFSNFAVLEGPEQATGWSLTNGVLTEYISFTYLLKAVKAGHFVISAASIKVDGKVYRSNTSWVDVAGSGITRLAEDNSLMNEFIVKKGENIRKKINSNIFVKLDVNKSQVFEGEPLVATYKLYTRLKSESKVTRRPSFNGFSVYDMVDPEREEAGREMYNGREYNVYLLRKVQLYPLQSGKLELDPVEVDNNLTFVQEESMGSDYAISNLMRALANNNVDREGVIREQVTLTSNPVTIDVKPLPETSLPSFNGAIGKFSLKTRIAGGVIRKNDVVDVQLEVSGKGNFPVLAAPVIEWPDSIEAYESTVKEQFNKFVSPITGTKIFTYPVSFRKEGDIVIPPVNLYYFDPETGKYSIATSDSIKFHVDPSKVVAVSQTLQAPVTEAPGNAWKWTISVIGLLAVFGGLYAILRQNSTGKVKAKPVIRVEAPEPDPVVPIVDNDPVLKIRSAFEQGDYQLFYRELNKVINEWLKKKYGADGEGKWQQTLISEGVSKEIVMQIESLKYDAAMAMYTPFVMDKKMIDDLDSLQKIIG